MTTYIPMVTRLVAATAFCALSAAPVFAGDSPNGGDAGTDQSQIISAWENATVGAYVDDSSSGSVAAATGRGRGRGNGNGNGRNNANQHPQPPCHWGTAVATLVNGGGWNPMQKVTHFRCSARFKNGFSVVPADGSVWTAPSGSDQDDQQTAANNQCMGACKGFNGAFGLGPVK